MPLSDAPNCERESKCDDDPDDDRRAVFVPEALDASLFPRVYDGQHAGYPYCRVGRCVSGDPCLLIRKKAYADMVPAIAVVWLWRLAAAGVWPP